MSGGFDILSALYSCLYLIISISLFYINNIMLKLIKMILKKTIKTITGKNEQFF
jgi:hypothetical protein